MQIAIFQQDKQTTLSIECTAAGRQALSSDELSPRERQLLLLLDKELDLSRQAVTHLLQKININELADKGWVSYQLSTQAQLGESTAMINQLINVKFVNSVSKKSNSKKIKSFLTTTTNDNEVKHDALLHPDDNELSAQELTAVEDEIQRALNNHTQPKKSMANATMMAHTMPRHDSSYGKSFAYEPVHDSFEDIMIAQSLLDDE